MKREYIFNKNHQHVYFLKRRFAYKRPNVCLFNVGNSSDFPFFVFIFSFFVFCFSPRSSLFFLISLLLCSIKKKLKYSNKKLRNYFLSLLNIFFLFFFGFSLVFYLNGSLSKEREKRLFFSRQFFFLGISEGKKDGEAKKKFYSHSACIIEKPPSKRLKGKNELMRC